MGAMAEEFIFEAEPFIETCNRLYSKWKVRQTRLNTSCVMVAVHDLHLAVRGVISVALRRLPGF